MKSVLISIQPKYCELIASGEKMIEVRKTRPKLETPFKCYMYCTQSIFDITLCPDLSVKSVKIADKGRGKVIGEFVCDWVTGLKADNLIQAYYNNAQETCLTDEEIMQYANGKKLFYWHISALKIYDKPKELGKFRKAGFMTEEQWLYALYPNTHCHYSAWAKKFELTRPPQSWCYVEA